MEWPIRKKDLPEAIVRAAMSLYGGAIRKLEWDQSYLTSFGPVGVHQGSMLLPLLFEIAVDVITEHVKEELMNEILYANDVVLMSDSM